eukprot:SAG11_NODE_14654_length_604_cov_1.110891_1_plen_51_part_01
MTTHSGMDAASDAQSAPAEQAAQTESNRCAICLSHMLATTRAAVEGCFHMY